MVDLDQIYLVVQAAVEAMKDSCPCGCLDEAREGLLGVLQAIEGEAGKTKPDCCRTGVCRCI